MIVLGNAPRAERENEVLHALGLLGRYGAYRIIIAAMRTFVYAFVGHGPDDHFLLGWSMRIRVGLIPWATRGNNVQITEGDGDGVKTWMFQTSKVA